MIVIDCEQGTPEWLAARLGCATASEFGCIVAAGAKAGRETYAATLVGERLTKTPTAGFLSKAMQDGLDREPMGKALYQSARGVWLREVGFIRHDTMMAGASPDGLIGEEGGLELKCPQIKAHLAYRRLARGECPSAYWWQIQGQMWIAGLQWVDFVSYCPEMPADRQLVIRRIRRDEKAIDRLRVEVKLFLADVDAMVLADDRAEGIEPL